MNGMFERLVYISDELKDYDQIKIVDRNLECNSAQQTLRIKQALESVFDIVVHYSSIEQFTNNISSHKNDCVFPNYFGINNPTSKSIIPAICEGNNILYIGPDSYTQTLCNDKYISKLYANKFGIPSSKCELFHKSAYTNNYKGVVEKISRLKLPVIVKPNFGGSSTGISRNSVYDDYSTAAKQVLFLFQYHHINIIVEEYFPGTEVEFIIMGNHKKIFLNEAVKVTVDGVDYFDRTNVGFEDKYYSTIKFDICNLIPQRLIENFIKLFHSFEKVEYMRIDCRVNKGGVNLLELSPDPYLGDDDTFYYAFLHNGISHPQMLKMLVQNSTNQLEYQIPSSLKNQP